MKKKGRFITLRVQKAKKVDIGRDVIRIGQKSMNKLKVHTGDVIEIVGKKRSAGIAWPSYPQDTDLGIVRIDLRLQKNTGTRVDDLLEVRKVKAKIAQSIVIAPVDLTLRNTSRFEAFVKRKLNNYPVALDDYIYISLGISREMCFNVISLRPKGICVIKQGTMLSIDESIFEITFHESLGKALTKINSLIEEQDADKITIQGQYLPEIFSHDLFEISKNDGFPTLKYFVLEYLMEHGIMVNSSIHGLQFRKGYIRDNLLRLKDEQIKSLKNSLILKDKQIKNLEASLSSKDKKAKMKKTKKKKLEKKLPLDKGKLYNFSFI